MSGEDKKEKGPSFEKALSGVTAIKSFHDGVLKQLEEQEEGIHRPEWRKKFRRELPFWSLLSPEQRRHVRNIFAHMLPDPDVDTSSFDPEERLMLDIVAEQYIRQALLFAQTVEQEEYHAKEEVARDYPGRVLVLTFSASLFFFDVPDNYGKRGYTYQNIYGNRSIPASGRCRLKGLFERRQSLQTLEFHTSAVQLVAVTKVEVQKLQKFEHESQLFHRKFSDTFHGISVKARDTFSGFVHELTSSSQIDVVKPQGEGEDDDNQDEEPSTPDNLARLPLPGDRKDSRGVGGDSSPGSKDPRRSGTFNSLPEDHDP